jgi:glutathione S-transferase
MKLYIADQTCSQAVQIIANELGLNPDVIHYDVFDRSTSTGEDFSSVNPLLYVPVLELDTPGKDRLTETIVVISYLADQHPDANLAPARGTLERTKLDQLLVFIATEIAQKHIPLMRKLQTEEGAAWTRNKLTTAYKTLDDRLAKTAFIDGDNFSIADAYVWATMWQERSGVDISHLENLKVWKARMDARASVQKALEDEAAAVAIHRTRQAA